VGISNSNCILYRETGAGAGALDTGDSDGDSLGAAPGVTGDFVGDSLGTALGVTGDTDGEAVGVTGDSV